MLYFVFTVDGDWEEYYDPRLPEEKRKPDQGKMLSWADQEIKLAGKLLAGRFVHFIHTSPRAKDFFLLPDFISRWKEIEARGGSVGVHCHEDDPRRAYYYNDKERMEKAIGFLAEGLKKKGLTPAAFRGGYMAFSPKTIPILEQNNIYLDFSCEPGRYLFHGDLLVSDWRGASDNYYQMGYSDHRKPGGSQVFEVPLGFYIENDSMWKIWKKARALKRRKENVIVSVLAHSYEFRSFIKRLKIKLALLILKIYGRFVSAGEVLEMTCVNKEGERQL